MAVKRAYVDSMKYCHADPVSRLYDLPGRVQEG